MSVSKIDYDNLSPLIKANIDYINGSDPLPKNTLDAFINIKKAISKSAKEIVCLIASKNNDEDGILDVVGSLLNAKDTACASIIIGTKLPSNNKEIIFTDETKEPLDETCLVIYQAVNKLIREVVAYAQSVPFYYAKLWRSVVMFRMARDVAINIVKRKSVSRMTEN